MAADGTLSRPLFFDRQNLRADDLNAIIDYLRESRRRLNRHAIGWGVTCGLEVRPDTASPWRVTVGPGFALAPSGHEIAVPEGGSDPFDVCPQARACLDIPGPCPDPDDLDGDHDAIGGSRAVDFTDGSQPVEAGIVRDISWALIAAAPSPVTHLDPTLNHIVTQDGLTALRLGPGGGVELAAPTDNLQLTMATEDSPPQIIARDAAGAVVDDLILTADAMQPQTVTLSGAGIRFVEFVSDGSDLFMLDMSIRDEGLGWVYLAICPFERPYSPRPAIPEKCEQPNAAARFARICEEYELRVLCDLPDSHTELDCEEVQRQIL